MSEEVWDNHKSAVVEEYHSTLCNFMQEIGCETKPPSLAEIHKYMKERAIYGMIVSLLFLPVILLDKADSASMEEMMLGNKTVNPGFDNPVYRRMILKRLETYDQMGLLDL